MNVKFTDFTRMKSIAERDRALEELWAIFGDIPIDADSERIQESFIGYPAGTHREEIWHWFDAMYSKGLAYLMFKDGATKNQELKEIVSRRQMCEECMSETCAFNPEGICMFPMVYGKKAELNEDGCQDWVLGNYDDRKSGEAKT